MSEGPVNLRRTLRRANGDAQAVGQNSSPGIPPLIKRNTIYFVLTQALQGAQGQLSITLGALMVVRLLGSPALAGIGGSLLGMGRFLVAYPTGKLTDTYGRRVGMVVGLVLGLVGGIGLGVSVVASSFPLFLVGMSVLGLGVGAGQQLRVAAVDMYPPSRRAEGLGYVLTGSVVGAFIAPMLVAGADWVAARTGGEPLAVTWFLMPMALVPAIALTLMVRPDPKAIAADLKRYWPNYQPPPSQAGQQASAARSGLWAFMRHPTKQVAYVSYAAAQGTMAMMMVMTPLVMHSSGHQLSLISFAVSLHVVGMFGFSIVLGRWADRIGRKPLLWAGLLTQALGAVLVPVTSFYWIITLGLFLVGVGWSAVNVSSTTVLADTTGPEERGRAVGANDALAGAWSILTPLASGLVAEASGLMVVGMVGAAMAGLPLLLMGRLREVSPGRYTAAAAAPLP
ncbi:MAG: MFS transporter [Chloroflexi bacterium]|nr:MFS transporter [Chloroflexota bacterium]